MLKVIWSKPGVVLELSTAARSDPAPESLVVVTVKLAAARGPAERRHRTTPIREACRIRTPC